MEIKKPGMIPFEEALQIVQNNAITLGAKKVKMVEALNRVLAEDVISDIDMPPFDKSAMDGYACIKSDVMNPMEVIEEIAAGTIPIKRIEKGQCSRIMTGAIVPDGADIVLMKEFAVISASGKIICSKEPSNSNICYKGEDIKKGGIILRKGTVLHPQHIALLASVGCINPLVYQIPSVAVISTGNELVEPSQIPGTSQIRNSNSYQILTQVMQMGLLPDYLGIAADNELALENILTEAFSKYTVILISGGVSVGDYDFVPKVLTKLGVDIKFHGILAKPGKHLLFGTKKDKYIFGLPGNPVSSFVQFEVLVKPLLNALMGNSSKPIFLQIPIHETYTRKKSDVLSFIPVSINDQGNALPLEYHGSAHIHSYTIAKGILEMPVGISEFKKGDIVRVRPL